MKSTQNHGHLEPRRHDISPGRIILFALNLAGLVAILAGTLGSGRSASGQTAFSLAYLYSVVLLLLVRPVLGVEPSSRPGWVVGDSVALLVMDAAVLVLLSAIGTPGTDVIPASIILVASAALGTCAALHTLKAPSAGHGYLLSTLLLSVTPVVAWLGLSEVARVRIDWFLALSPIGAAAASVIP